MGLKIYYTGIILALFGCSTPPPVSEHDLSSDLARLSLAFDSVNQKILGEEFLATKGDLTSFNLESYRHRLAGMSSKRPMELQEGLKDYDKQELRSFPKTFLICVYSKKNAFAMCDDARCSGVERKAIAESSAIIEAWLKELPLKNCPAQ